VTKGPASVPRVLGCRSLSRSRPLPPSRGRAAPG
jgi:hypothetical protein